MQIKHRNTSRRVCKDNHRSIKIRQLILQPKENDHMPDRELWYKYFIIGLDLELGTLPLCRYLWLQKKQAVGISGSKKQGRNTKPTFDFHDLRQIWAIHVFYRLANNRFALISEIYYNSYDSARIHSVYLAQRQTQTSRWYLNENQKLFHARSLVLCAAEECVLCVSSRLWNVAAVDELAKGWERFHLAAFKVLQQNLQQRRLVAALDLYPYTFPHQLIWICMEMLD